jgi:dolichol-phosphate mannosyltransferase
MNEKKKNFISMIVPVYNKDSILSLSINRISSTLQKISLDYEIILVNDGSYDNTLNVANEEAEKNPKIKVLSYSSNLGKGFAVRTGIKQSTGDIVIFMDGDVDISPTVISKFIDQIQNYDMVIGSKWLLESEINELFSRKLLSKTFGFLVRIFIGLKLKDTQVGLKVGKGNFLRKIVDVMTVNRFAFDVELLTISTILNMKIKEMPIKLSIDKKFKVSEMFIMLLDIIRIAYRIKITRKYHKKLQIVKSTF